MLIVDAFVSDLVTMDLML